MEEVVNPSRASRLLYVNFRIVSVVQACGGVDIWD
jgi:hypothetical protein